MHLRWEQDKLAFAHCAYCYFIWMFELHSARNDGVHKCVCAQCASA